MTRRPHMPLSVKLDAAILQLRLTPGAVEYDHDPALELRPFDEATGKYSPDANNPKYIVLKTSADHAHKTNKDNGTGRSDKGAIAHVRHLSEAQIETRRRILARKDGERKPRSKLAGRKLQSRGFEKRRART